MDLKMRAELAQKIPRHSESHQKCNWTLIELQNDQIILSISNGALHKGLEVVLGCFNIQSDSLLLDVWVTYDNHNVGRRGEFIDEGGELLITDDHRLELETSFNTAKLELLYDIADFLKTMDILVLFCVVM